MRRSILITLVAAALLAVGGATAGTASSDGKVVVGSASGWYGFTGTAAGSFFDVRPFWFRVKAYDDGTADGKFSYRQVRDGVELTVEGSLTCATIRGNQAWVGGVIEASSRRARDVVPGPGQRRQGARHVVDGRRRRPRNGQAVLHRRTGRPLPVLPRLGAAERVRPRLSGGVEAAGRSAVRPPHVQTRRR